MGGCVMEPKDIGPDWQELSEEAITGVKEWRLQNPKATFAEIEMGAPPSRYTATITSTRPYWMQPSSEMTSKRLG